MEQSVSQRLMRYLEFKGIRIGRAEKDLGLSNGYIKKLKGSPSAEKLDLILTAYIDLSRNWLLYGTGNMLNDDYTTFEPVGVVGTAASTPTSQGAMSEVEKEVVILKAQLEEKEKMINILESQLAELNRAHRELMTTFANVVTASVATKKSAEG